MWSVLFSGTVNLHLRQQYTMGAFSLSLCQYLSPFIFFIKKHHTASYEVVSHCGLLLCLSNRQ